MSSWAVVWGPYLTGSAEMSLLGLIVTAEK